MHAAPECHREGVGRAVIVADEWLLSVGLMGPTGRAIAQLCLRTQTRAFRLTGHILDLTGERERLAIHKACRLGCVPHVVVRCMRCGSRAWLADWHASITRETPETEYALSVFRHKADQYGLDFHKQCNGDDTARGLSALLGPRDGEVRW